jgi:hypothetical protein
MYRHSRVAAVFGCMATLAMVGCATNAGVAPLTGSTMQQSQSTVPTGPDWIYQNGVLFHKPHFMATRQMAAGHRVNSNLLLTYGGGPVLVKAKIYLIFWGYKTYGDADNVKPLLKDYIKHMGGSAHNNIYTQYYETLNAKTVDIKNPKRELAGIWEDDTDAVPTNPSQSQVAAEAGVGVTHFGFDPNGEYVVATPHGRSTPGFGTSFCAYHDDAFSGNNIFSFTNLPYMPDAGSSCGANITTAPSDESSVDEGVTIVEGHEEGESVTDPQPFSGWNSQQGEIGDICAWIDIENDPFGKKSYTMQPMYSNATESCVHSY